MQEKWDMMFAYQIMEVSDQAMFLFSPDDFTVIYANKKAKNIFGEGIIGRPCYEGIAENKRPCIDCPFMNIKVGEECLAERHFESYDSRVKGNGLMLEDGTKVIFCTIQDSDSLLQIRSLQEWENTPQYEEELAKSHERIRYRAEYDLLTDLHNASRFYMDAANLVRESPKNHAIISFDIEHFKMINDLFGMKAGDDVLRHVAGVLKQVLPADSICCRVHSDVFFICVPYTKKGEIIKLIERIRKAIYKNEFAFDINTSFGVYLVQDWMIPINLMCDRATLAGRTVKSSAMNFCAFYDEQYRTEE